MRFVLLQKAGKPKEALIWTGFKKDFQKRKLCRIIEQTHEKRDKKIQYHIKGFSGNKIPRRVKMKAKIIGNIGIFVRYFYEKKHVYNLWKRK